MYITYNYTIEHTINYILIVFYWAYVLSTVKCEDGDVQLYGTTYTRVGILTVCVNGTWSKVCGTTDDNIMASIVCAQLGYSPHGNIYCLCVCVCLYFFYFQLYYTTFYNKYYRNYFNIYFWWCNHTFFFVPLGAKVDITTSYNSVYPTRIFDMQCFGNETKLLDCPHQESYTQSCSSYFTTYCQKSNELIVTY